MPLCSRAIMGRSSSARPPTNTTGRRRWTATARTSASGVRKLLSSASQSLLLTLTYCSIKLRSLCLSSSAPPDPSSGSNSQDKAEIGEDLTLTIRFTSNPAPTQVLWEAPGGKVLDGLQSGNGDDGTGTRNTEDGEYQTSSGRYSASKLTYSVMESVLFNTVSRGQDKQKLNLSELSVHCLAGG